MLERNNPKPLYQQLRDVLVDAIESGKWGPNDRIPSENNLSTTYGLSRMTVRAVLTDMVKEPQICEILAKEERLGEAVALLQNKALEAGGRDNITIVLCEVKDNISNKKIGEWLKMLLTGKR